MSDSVIGSESTARLFHEAYERLAPSFGYETRKASAVPWEDVPEPNRSLMIAVAGEVRAAIQREAVDAFIHDELPDLMRRASSGAIQTNIQAGQIARRIAELRDA